MSGRQAGLLLALALAVHAGLALHTLSGNAATFDEGAHLPAGYTHLALGDHRLNPEQPPLMKVLAAAPLLAVAPEVRTDHVAWTAARQWAVTSTSKSRSGLQTSAIIVTRGHVRCVVELRNMRSTDGDLQYAAAVTMSLSTHPISCRMASV